MTLGLLQVAGLTGVLSRDSFPLASEVIWRLAQDATGAQLWQSVGQTLMQALAGLLAGTAMGVPLGLALGRAQTLERCFRPIIEFVRPIPSVAILPLVILTAGVRFQAAAILTTVSSLWLVLVLTMSGARAVDPVAEQTLLAFGVPKMARIRHLLVPSATPFIVTGVRIAASVSLIVAVTAELLGGMAGIGKDMTIYLQNADKTGMYALIAVAGLLGLALNLAFKPLENLLLAWHPSRRGPE